MLLIFSSILLVLISPGIIIEPNNALHINIEFILPKNNSDPNLAELFKKVINVNVTAVAESVDKHIIRVDSVLALNRTIEFKNNRLVLDNEADLIKKLIELSPLIANVSSSVNSSSSSSRTTATTSRWSPTRRTTTRSPDHDFFDDYDLSQLHHASTHSSYEFSEYSTELDELTSSSSLFEFESTVTNDENHHQTDHSTYAPSGYEDYNYPNYPPQSSTTTTTTRRTSSTTRTTTTSRITTQRGQRTTTTTTTSSPWQRTTSYRTTQSRNSTTTTQRWTTTTTTTQSSRTSYQQTRTTTTPYTRYPTKTTLSTISSRTTWSSSKTPNRTTTTTKKTTTTTTQFPKVKCPPIYKNFCLNAAECYYKSRADLDLGEEPLCECARPISILYGVLKKSNAGVRCELVAYSFTPLGYALAVVLTVLIVFLLFTLCGFICGCRRRGNGPEATTTVAAVKKNKSSKKPTVVSNEAKPKCSNSDQINDSWRFVKSDPATKSRNEFYFKRFRGGASGGRTIQKYIEKHTRNILKSIEGLMAGGGEQQGNNNSNSPVHFRPHLDLTDNFIFVNRCFREDGGGASGGLNDPQIAIVSTNEIGAKCASNIGGVYPKPMRSSNDDNNVFNARCGQNEQTVVNGSLFY